MFPENVTSESTSDTKTNNIISNSDYIHKTLNYHYNILQPCISKAIKYIQRILIKEYSYKDYDNFENYIKDYDKIGLVIPIGTPKIKNRIFCYYRI